MRLLSLSNPEGPGRESEGGRGLLYIAASAFFFSVMSLLVKVAGAGLPTMEIVLLRSVLVAILAAGTGLARGRDLRGQERGFLVLRGVLGFAALSGFYYGLIHLPLAEATVIQYTNPVFTALIAAAVLGEALRPGEVVLTLTGLAGVVLVARPATLFGEASSSLPVGAVLIALTGALFSAGAYVTVRRLRREFPSVVVFWFSLVCVLASLPFALSEWEGPSSVQWAVIVGIGVSTHLGQLFVTSGLQLERAGRAMTVGYLQIVFAALWGAIVFAEIPGGWAALGGLVIVASTLALGRR